MPLSNQPPYTADQIAGLIARVENLERKRPASVAAGSSDGLWSQLAGVLAPSQNPTNVLITASSVIHLHSLIEMLIDAPTLLSIQSLRITLTASVIDVDGVTRWTETTAPSGAPPAGFAFEWYEDNGAGKMRKMVRFPTGAAQQVWIEP